MFRRLRSLLKWLAAVVIAALVTAILRAAGAVEANLDGGGWQELDLDSDSASGSDSDSRSGSDSALPRVRT